MFGAHIAALSDGQYQLFLYKSIHCLLLALNERGLVCLALLLNIAVLLLQCLHNTFNKQNEL